MKKYDAVALRMDPKQGYTSDQIKSLMEKLKEDSFTAYSLYGDKSEGLLLVGKKYADQFDYGDDDDLIESMEAVMEDEELKHSNHVYTWNKTEVYFGC